MKLIKTLTDDPRVKQLGPGLITGAADDDPSGIATYSQAGAQFGYSMLWTVLLTYPLMVGIQMVSARLGYITGRGLAANVKAVFPRPVLFGIVGLLLVANTINIAADIAAMGEALRLLIGGSAHLYSVCEINGIIAVPIMAVMMVLASRKDIMGTFVIRPRLQRLGWAATAVMGITVVAMLSTG